MTPVFPWSAVVGQERLKLALALSAIDPHIGGVLVRGPRGVAKSTLARAFAELLPGRFVELPLGATEERVAGSLDLEKALAGGQVQFKPGLLSSAHCGVLYVDEVNLLSDPLVDLLLDAAASGRNVIERDGVSHVHESRFVLIGTMNPEEGELRPQFVDRFGLSVSAERDIEPARRMEIVAHRLDFERDPVAFRARYADEQRTLLKRCARARERVERIGLGVAARERVAELCHAAGVEGVRADLAMLRAARAHAAWQGRDEMLATDVDAVAELALAHRRAPGDEPGGASGERSGRGSAGAPPAARREPQRAAPEAAPESGPASPPAGDRGALPPVPVRSAAVPASSASVARWLGGAAQGLGARGRRQRARGRAPGAIDWFRTLAHYQRPGPLEIHRRRVARGERELWVLAVDCSSSMLHGGLALAKGLARALCAYPPSRSVDVALLSFRADEIRSEMTARASSAALGRAICALGAGGGTPLDRALRQALALCAQRSSRSEYARRRLLVFTDGRTRQGLEGPAPALSGVERVVFDCERGPLFLGRARRLSHWLRASYVHADSVLARSSSAASPEANAGVHEVLGERGI